MSMIKKSPWVSIFNSGGCKGCGLECITLITPKYDIERFGCLLRPSARHADILLVTGVMNKQSKARLKNIYEQMAPNKRVIAVGACAISGGIFQGAYNASKGIDKDIPVDVYVPGCPPKPEAIIDALLKVLKGFDGRKKG
ncbi:MAG: NADH-quinone oxidoreductase subunit B [Theionarchaea archaeon DG-70]|nr:MAG: NADH-quinone oxidoreductase subunit B [Theionarchaea archaeon DG-70]